MYQFKGTQGHWYADEESWVDNHTAISTDQHGAFALVLHKMDDEGYRDAVKERENKELEANVRLITSAPELHAALCQALPYVRQVAGHDGHAHGTLVMIHNLLKKIEGGF